MDRTILHINVAHFHVAVACIGSPRLASHPLAVRAPGSRRVLLDVSEEAWRAGVGRGMTFEAAKRICPDLQLLDPQPAVYERVGSALFEKACTLSPQVERAGPGHFFVDLTGTQRLLGPAVDVADRMRASIRESCRIDPVVGIAASRLVSKIATRVIKPKGFCTVISGCEEEFMAPLPLAFLPGVDKRQLDQLQQFNLHLIRDLTRIPVKTLATAIGPAALDIHRQARGIDPTPVRSSADPAPSVEERHLLAEPTNDDALLSVALFDVVARACARIRAMGLAAGSVSLAIRYADGASVARTLAIQPPINGDLGLYDRCTGLFRKLHQRRVRLTELILSFPSLTFPYGQLDLFDRTDREEQLMAALDSIRGDYGRDSIRFWGRERAA